MKEILNKYAAGNKTELFSQWVFIGMIAIMVMAMAIDFSKGEYLSLFANILIIFICILFFIHLIKSSNTEFPAIGLIMIFSLLSNALFVAGEFKGSGIFILLAPLGFFLLFSLKNAIVLTVMHFTLSLIVFSYGVLSYDLHDRIDVQTLVFSAFYVVLFGFFYHLSIENSYRKLANANRQKEILLSEVHHRVKNSLNIVSSTLGLQVLNLTDEKSRDVIIKNRLRIDAIAMVHEILYQYEDFENISCHTYMKRLGNLVLSMYDKQVSLHVEKSDVIVPFEIMIKLGIITNELLINSIKYGVDSGGEIVIEVMKKGKKISYFYKDNGKGMENTDTLFSGTSLGLKLVDLTARQLDAKMCVKNDNGLQYKMEFTI